MRIAGWLGAVWMGAGAVVVLASEAPLVLTAGIGLLIAGVIQLVFVVASPDFTSGDGDEPPEPRRRR